MPRLVEQSRLDLQQVVALDQLQSAGLFVGVFEHGQTGGEGRLFEDDLERLGEHVAQAANAPAVMLRRPVALAQADHQHLADAALECAAEVRVRLDARDRHDVVGLQGVFVPVDRFAPAIGSDAAPRSCPS